MLGTLQCSDFAAETFCNKVQERPWVAIMGGGGRSPDTHLWGPAEPPGASVCGACGIPPAAPFLSGLSFPLSPHPEQTVHMGC